MKINKIILALLSTVFIFSSCEDLLTPANENIRNRSGMSGDPLFAVGILQEAYLRIPTNSYSFNDVASDDAVSNDITNSYRKMATGQWAANNNPLDKWRMCYNAIQYLNIFIEEVDSVHWGREPLNSKLFADRFKGEAYGLRAMYMYYLLQAHAGMTESGDLLGVPIITTAQMYNTDFNLPRNKFDDCMTQIYSDLDKAEDLLPTDYNDLASNATVDTKFSTRYSGIKVTDYNRVMGATGRSRVSGRIAMAIRAQAALLAASPAFNPTNDLTKWAKAADYAAKVIDLNNGVTGVSATGYKWYSKDLATEINNSSAGNNQAEVLWRTDIVTDRALEADNYPPTLFGKGRVNPTQNLVDAFPMANGYPIGETTSLYNSSAPYTGRDPRLKEYILYNGGTAGPSNVVITTAADGTTNDALNKNETSTRTGYYMRKLLRQDVNCNPSTLNTQKHVKVRIRYTEIYLIYAEAANRAWGPTGNGGHAYSAFDVIKKIRTRAGVGTTNNDAYLSSINANQSKMEDLIRNERRLELCFEGFRISDLQRWNLLSATGQDVKGMSITGGTNFTPIAVEDRTYSSYMNFGPVPFSETLKFNLLIQNKGWK